MKLCWLAITAVLLIGIVDSLKPYRTTNYPSYDTIPIDENEKCLAIPEVFPKKYFHQKHKPITITIQASDERVIQQLTSWIFYIFAKEVLGYASVQVIIKSDIFDVEYALEDLSDLTTTVAKSTLNVEAWIPPEYDTYIFEYVQTCGNVAPPGRFGWFIPMDMTEPFYTQYNPQNDPEVKSIHWRYFKNEDFVSIFDLDSTTIRHLINNYGKIGNEYMCNEEPQCQNGMYTPEWCLGKPCAVLLAAQYDATSWIVNHIEEDRLLVKVIFVGKNLYNAAKDLKKRLKRNPRKSMIMLTWFPSDVILFEEDYVTVAFESSEKMNFTRLYGYKYEMHRLTKVAWTMIQEYATPLYQGFRSFTFNTKQFRGVLLHYDKYRDQMDSGNMSLYGTACDWFRNNHDTWVRWKSNNQKTKLYIGGIFPYTGSSYNGLGIVVGAHLAMAAINKNTTVLPDYDLSILSNDGMCQADNVMRQFIEYIRVDQYYNHLLGVLGPACSDTVEPLAGVSRHYKVMVISYSAEGSNFHSRDKYPYFFRTIGENTHYNPVYIEMFKRWNWRRLAALAEDGQKYTEYLAELAIEMADQKPSIEFIANKKFPRVRSFEPMTRYLEDLKSKSARIIIADVVDEVARQVMCEAYKLKMTARDGYVWFLPSWLNETWYDTDTFNTPSKSVNCTTAQMLQAVQGYFSLNHAYFAPDDAIIQEGITVAEWKVKYKDKLSNSTPSNYASFAYDAVWVYALAYDKLTREDPEAASDLHDGDTIDKLVDIVKKTDFNGVSGRIKFRGGPSRFSLIHVTEFYNGQRHKVAVFSPVVADDNSKILGGNLTINETALKWFTPNGKVPDDGKPIPACAIQGIATFLGVECQTAVIIVNVAVAIFLILIVCGVCFYLKIKYDEKVKKHKEYMEQLGVTLDENFPKDMKKYELNREEVVITRKLGEGAFGTVYGGDVIIPVTREPNKPPTREWVPIAVKTLKLDASNQDKVDFMSEANIMTRLDHKNIVKLIGVVTKTPPIYTVMELMLLGDLKTYMLARRHLAGMAVQNKTYVDEVSPKRLTNMALDIARGLSYLAQNRLVHRDLASRNCLVDSDKTVKIGDFGMTRSLSDEACYTLHRKGKLPVRWMAPESLTDGVYTLATDVWSYAVVLYEITTFGSLPFYGRSNEEVVEMVKAGRYLEPPPGAKAQLEALLRSCWHQNPKSRPSASQIVEYLANNGRLLEPCIEATAISIDLSENRCEDDVPKEMQRSSSAESHLDYAPSTSSSRPMCSSEGNLADAYPDKTIDCESIQKKRLTFFDDPVSLSITDGSPPRYTEEDESEAFQMDQMVDSDNYCPQRPLLGKGKSTSSLVGKYQIGSCRRDSGCQDEDEGFIANSPPPNGYLKGGQH